jgi:hypothetical protein
MLLAKETCRDVHEMQAFYVDTLCWAVHEFDREGTIDDDNSNQCRWEVIKIRYQHVSLDMLH